MPTFIGYSTIDRYRDFTVTDFELIKRDLLNSLNIRQGEVPGRPEVGTTIWSLIYEPQNAATTNEINREIQRVVAQDPRISISDINVYAQDNGILVELEVDTVSGQNAEMLQVFFDQQQQRATYSDV
jgi:phage baseplate assembly protein W